MARPRGGGASVAQITRSVWFGLCRNDGDPMPTINQTVLNFDFGVATYAINGFGPSGTIAAGDTATMAALGVNFTYSSALSNSNIDTANSGMLNVRGTDTLALAPSNASHFFSNATLDFGIVFGTASVSFLNSTGGVVGQFTNADINPSGSLYFAGQFSSVRFKSSLLMNIDTMTVSLNCFLTGTQIMTPSGPKPVEDLEQGDLISTALGGTTTLHWRGEQHVNAQFRDPEKINPICVRADALRPGFPARDLYVSGDHALGIDGQLINAFCLVNGDTIYQVSRMSGEFTYHHLQTDCHELILAEAVPVESFVDYAGYDHFDNPPNTVTGPAIAEMSLPRISAKRLVDPILQMLLSDDRMLAA